MIPWIRAAGIISFYVISFLFVWKYSKSRIGYVPELGTLVVDKKHRQAFVLLWTAVLIFIIHDYSQPSGILLLLSVPFVIASTFLTYFVARRAITDRISAASFVLYFAVLFLISLRSWSRGATLLSIIALIFSLQYLIQRKYVRQVSLSFHIVCNAIFILLIAYFFPIDHRLAISLYLTSLIVPIFFAAIYALSWFYYQRILPNEFELKHSCSLPVITISILNIWFLVASMLLYERYTGLGLLLYLLSLCFLSMLYLPSEANSLKSHLILSEVLANPYHRADRKRTTSI
jgi:hypothetical protein